MCCVRPGARVGGETEDWERGRSEAESVLRHQSESQVSVSESVRSGSQATLDTAGTAQDRSQSCATAVETEPLTGFTQQLPWLELSLFLVISEIVFIAEKISALGSA